MSNDNIISFKQPEESASDSLTELLRNGAKELINQAVQAELEELFSQYSELKIDGKQAVVRNGYLPRRTVQTGLGDVEVQSQRYATSTLKHIQRAAANDQPLPFLYEATNHEIRFRDERDLHPLPVKG